MDAQTLTVNLQNKLKEKGFNVSVLQNYGEKFVMVVSLKDKPNLRLMLSFYNIPITQGSAGENAEVEILNTVSQVIKTVFGDNIVTVNNTIINTRRLFPGMYDKYRLVPLLQIIPEPTSMKADANMIINYIFGTVYVPDLRKAKQQTGEGLYHTVVDDYPLTAIRFRKLYKNSGEDRVGVGFFVDYRLPLMRTEAFGMLMGSVMLPEAMVFGLYKLQNQVVKSVNFGVVRGVVNAGREYIQRLYSLSGRINKKKLQLAPVHGFEVIPSKSQFTYRVYYDKHLMSKHLVAFKGSVPTSVDMPIKIMGKFKLYQDTVIQKLVS